MNKKLIATAVSVALGSTVPFSVTAAENTMVKLIDALYESGSINSKAYGALRASAQA